MLNADPASVLIDRSPAMPAPALLEAEGHRAMQRAYLWVLASLATALLLIGVAYAVAARSECDAGRMIVAAQRGYAVVLVNGLAAHHSRPTR